MNHTGRDLKRLSTAVALGVAVLLLAAWLTETGKWPGSKALPDRVCWGSIDQSLLTDAAPPGDEDWEVEERKDHWGDPMCTVENGDWQLSTTVMKTPLKAHLWWTLGTVPLGDGLPGMIKTSGNRIDGWIQLSPCEDKLVNVSVPGADSDRETAADLAARTLLAVGNAWLAQCGGKPLPEPADFDWSRMEPVRPARNMSPCGVELPESVRERSGGELSQLGDLGEAPVARCSALQEGDEASGLGLFSAVVLRDEATVEALSPTGVRATVRVSPAGDLSLTREDLRYDRDAVTRLVCAAGDTSSFVHVIASGTDAEYSAIKRAVLNEVADGMGCR